MLRVNDDKDDELFRKAAENYFPGADEPDWDLFVRQQNMVAHAINPEPAEGEKINTAKIFPGFIKCCMNNSSRHHTSFFRFFRFSAWLGKLKKKITPVIFLLQSGAVNMNKSTICGK